MGQILQGCARTTKATGNAIQNSQESLRKLASKFRRCIGNGLVEPTLLDYAIELS